MSLYLVVAVNEKYGLKGMIDASVRVEVGSNKYKTSEKVVPLEFKSGKPPNGREGEC